MKKILLNLVLISIFMISNTFAASIQDGRVAVEKFVYNSVPSFTVNPPTVKWLDDKSGGSLLVLTYENSMRTMKLSRKELDAAVNGKVPPKIAAEIKSLVESSDPNDE